MSNPEMRSLRQENTILRLRVEVEQLKRRCERQQRQINQDQKYIGQLHAQLRATPKSIAEAVFGKGKE